jgi:hypothetical protein
VSIRPALADAAAILVFVTIGLVSHHDTLGASGYARDALPFLCCWFGAALAFRLYTAPGRWRLAATWAVGVPAAVLVRGLALGRSPNGGQAAFLLVSLVTIGVLVAAARLVLRLLDSRTRRATP